MSRFNPQEFFNQQEFFNEIYNNFNSKEISNKKKLLSELLKLFSNSYYLLSQNKFKNIHFKYFMIPSYYLLNDLIENNELEAIKYLLKYDKSVINHNVNYHNITNLEIFKEFNLNAKNLYPDIKYKLSSFKSPEIISYMLDTYNMDKDDFNRLLNSIIVNCYDLKLIDKLLDKSKGLGVKFKVYDNFKKISDFKMMDELYSRRIDFNIYYFNNENDKKACYYTLSYSDLINTSLYQKDYDLLKEILKYISVSRDYLMDFNCQGICVDSWLGNWFEQKKLIDLVIRDLSKKHLFEGMGIIEGVEEIVMGYIRVY